MSRFLFVVPPLLGHVQPARAVADELTRRGHEVAWVGSVMTLRPVLGEAARIYRTGTRIHRAQADRGLASIRSLWQEFIVSYTKFIRPAVARAAADFEPDVIVTDQHAPAGAIVAEQTGRAWAVLACSTIELIGAFAAWPGIEAWLAEQRRRVVTEAGLPADFDFRFSPVLTLSLTTPGLTGPLAAPAPVVQVGPCLGARPDDPDFDWAWLDGRPLMLISVGTLADELAGDFYARAIAATTCETQVILIGDPDRVAAPPAHVRVLSRVPMLALLPRTAVVVSHGGLNTVSEALAHAVPLVLAPIRHDQPINARLVVAAGAGRRVNFNRCSPAELGTAIADVRRSPRYREAAAALAAEIRHAGGASAAADHLEGLPSMSNEPVLAGEVR